MAAALATAVVMRMRGNKIQFAVVREDPALPATLVDRFAARRVLLIGSGGCTGLTLRCLHPDLKITLLDPNPAQLALIERKASALGAPPGSRRRALFNIDDDRADGLSQCGNFESLFRGLRGFLNEFIATDAEILHWFTGTATPIELAAAALQDPYWPVAFELFLHAALLNTMFGPDATQHAQPGTYPRYFRERFERGLARADARDNYFLHHMLLGRYLDRESSLPIHLARSTAGGPLELRCGLVQDCADLATFDLVDLSNIMDWMAPAAIATLADALTQMHPGAAIVYRQLNNRADRQAAFGGAFRFDPDLGHALLARDRSLFYESIHVGIRSG